MIQPNQNLVIAGVRQSLERVCDSVDVHAVGRGENRSLHLELSFATPTDELSTGDAADAISEVAGAYWGAIQSYPNAFDRAVIDFPTDEDGEEDLTIRYELPTESVRKHVQGEMSEAKLMASVHESMHVIDEDGVPRSGEEVLEELVDDVDAALDEVVVDE